MKTCARIFGRSLQNKSIVLCEALESKSVFTSLIGLIGKLCKVSQLLNYTGHFLNAMPVREEKSHDYSEMNKLIVLITWIEGLQ